MEIDLVDDGVLWLINSTVFHPRGFALAVDSESGKLFLVGNGTEVWTFADESQDKFLAVEALFDRVRNA